MPQGEPLGNGHAVYVARQHLDGPPVLIIFGDTIIKGDLKRLLESPRSLAGVKEVDDPRRLGVLELDRNGNVRRLIEKPEHPPTNLAVVGGYLIKNSKPLRAALELQIAEDRQARGEFWLADGRQLMIDAGEKMESSPSTRYLSSRFGTLLRPTYHTDHGQFLINAQPFSHSHESEKVAHP